MNDQRPQPDAPWYYVKDRKKVGPVDLDQLRQLALSDGLLPSDMVLRDGARKWVTAGSVAGLFGAAASPPPLPGVATTPPGQIALGEEQVAAIPTPAAASDSGTLPPPLASLPLLPTAVTPTPEAPADAIAVPDQPSGLVSDTRPPAMVQQPATQIQPQGKRSGLRQKWFLGSLVVLAVVLAVGTLVIVGARHFRAKLEEAESKRLEDTKEAKRSAEAREAEAKKAHEAEVQKALHAIWDMRNEERKARQLLNEMLKLGVGGYDSIPANDTRDYLRACEEREVRIRLHFPEITEFDILNYGAEQSKRPR